MKKIKINFKEAKKSFNFKLKGEELENSFGLSGLKLLNSNYMPFEGERFINLVQINNAVKAYMYNYHNSTGMLDPKLVVIDNNMKIRYVNLKTPDGLFENFSYTVIGSEWPTGAVNMRIGNEDILFLCFENAYMHRVSLDAASKVQAFQNIYIRSMCLGYNKLFALTKDNPYLVTWTENQNPMEWLTATKHTVKLSGEIGRVKRVCEFKGEVYIVCEYGFARITSNSDKTTFSSKICFKTGSRIFENSVSISGDSIMFLTEEGLYQFSGSTLKRVFTEIDGLIDGEFASEVYGGYYNNSYYASAKIKFQDGEIFGNEIGNIVNNVLIKVNIQDKDIEIFRGHSSCFLSEIRSEGYSKFISISAMDFKIYEIDEDESKIGSVGLLKIFETKNLSLDESDKYKVLKEICVLAAADCSLKIYTEDELVRTIPHQGSPEIKCYKILVKGKQFRLRLESSAAKISVKTLELKFAD